MKNADAPIYPSSSILEGKLGEAYDIPHIGLTKREHFTSLFLAAIISKDFGDGNKSSHCYMANEYADEFLKLLEKGGSNG